MNWFSQSSKTILPVDCLVLYSAVVPLMTSAKRRSFVCPRVTREPDSCLADRRAVAWKCSPHSNGAEKHVHAPPRITTTGCQAETMHIT